MAFLMLFWISFAKAHDVSTEQLLYTHLMKDYVKAVRPSSHFSLVTDINFVFALEQLIDVDEKDQIVKSRIWFDWTWNDTRLSWDPQLFDGVKSLHFPADKIWQPDIVLSNNADPKYKQVVVSTDIWLMYTGAVKWLAFALLQSSCTINVLMYPFDSQICNMTFTSWTYDTSHLKFNLESENGDLSNLQENSEWEIITMKIYSEGMRYACCEAEYPAVQIVLHLKRRSLYYVFNHIFPCILITIMSLLGFLIPARVGGKSNLCVTTTLAMGYYLKAINDTMPPNGTALPLIGMYYAVNFVLVTTITMVNVVILRVDRNGRRGATILPPWPGQWPIIQRISSILTNAAEKEEAQMLLSHNKNQTVTNSPYSAWQRRRFCVRSVIATNSCSGARLQRQRNSLDRDSPIPMLNSFNDNSISRSISEETLKQTARDKFDDFLNKIIDVLDSREIRDSHQQQICRVKEEWDDFARSLDYFFLCIFALITIFTSAIMLS